MAVNLARIYRYLQLAKLYVIPMAVLLIVHARILKMHGKTLLSAIKSVVEAKRFKRDCAVKNSLAERLVRSLA